MKKITLLISTILFLLYFISCASTGSEPISYAQKPSTEADIAVAKTIETMITAYNEHDIAKHLSCYAPDAKIDSKLTGGVISKDEYRQILIKRSKLTTIQLKNTKIIELSPTKYQVDSILSGRNSFNISYELVPLEGRWVVLEQRYK